MYINIFPRSGLMQLKSLLRRTDTAVASKWELSEDPVLGNPAGVRMDYSIDGSVDESLDGDHLPLTIILPPTIPTTTTTATGSNGAETVLPPIGTGVPRPILGTSNEPLTTSTSTAAPRPSSPTTTSPTPATSSTTSSSLGAPTHSSPAAADSGSSKMAGARLSTGAVVGIVMAVLSIILVMGVLAYRKRAIKRRNRMRRTWLPRPFVVETTTVVTDAPPNKGTRKGSSSGATTTMTTTSKGLPGETPSASSPPFGAKTIPRVKPPPVSLLSLPGLVPTLGSSSAAAGPNDLSSTSAERTNATATATAAAGRRLSSTTTTTTTTTTIADDGNHKGVVPDSLLLSQTYSAPSGGRVAHPRALTNIGVVRCIFEPSMPDELKIRVGEAMRILAEYDDGWGLCENLRGERGVVPLQCLDRGMGESSRPLSGQRRAVGGL